MKPIFQMTREEKLQEIVEYSPCRVERSTVLRTCWHYAAMTRNKSPTSKVSARVYDISYSMYARMKEG